MMIIVRTWRRHKPQPDASRPTADRNIGSRPTQPSSLRLHPNDVALLLPCTIPEAARKLKEDAPKANTDCSKRWL